MVGNDVQFRVRGNKLLATSYMLAESFIGDSTITKPDSSLIGDEGRI